VTRRPRTGQGLCLLAALLPPLALAAKPPAFEGNYEIWRNDSHIGEATTRQLDDAAGWRLENHSLGTRGSARLLGFEEHTNSAGIWWKGQPSPIRFSLAVNTAVKDIGWTADFDWTTDGHTRSGVVTLRVDEDEVLFETTSHIQDPLSAGLRIRTGLMLGEDHWAFTLVDSDEVEVGEFRAFAEERIDTALGCLLTRRVEKVRAPDSKRYTRTWYAKDHGWAPVKVEHAKTGGNQMETRILSLEVDGQPITPSPRCAGD
jgi:hypothetical protein